ncbi:hypothetical protein PMAYCL1PPCAC_27516, partial [Pristionchus mayeri]
IWNYVHEGGGWTEKGNLTSTYTTTNDGTAYDSDVGFGRKLREDSTPRHGSEEQDGLDELVFSLDDYRIGMGP